MSVAPLWVLYAVIVTRAFTDPTLVVRATAQGRPTACAARWRRTSARTPSCTARRPTSKRAWHRPRHRRSSAHRCGLKCMCPCAVWCTAGACRKACDALYAARCMRIAQCTLCGARHTRRGKRRCGQGLSPVLNRWAAGRFEVRICRGRPIGYGAAAGGAILCCRCRCGSTGHVPLWCR
jgi:hypothetical protein